MKETCSDEVKAQIQQKRDVIDRLADENNGENTEITNNLLQDIFYLKHKKKSTSKRVSAN